MAQGTNGLKPIGSSIDVGWEDGKPRELNQNDKSYLLGENKRVDQSKIFGRQPRPRSKNPPIASPLVDYGTVKRNAMDAIDLDVDTKFRELILQNAENLKQFEYLEKSLVTFQDASSAQASQLRQPPAVVKKADPGAISASHDPSEEKAKIKASKHGFLGDRQAMLQGATPMFEDKIIGHSSAMNPLSNIYAEGDPQYEDKHLVPLDPIIVEGEGFLYGIRSVQIVALKEIVRGYDFVNVFSGPNHSVAITAAGQTFTWGANNMQQLGYPGAEEGFLGIEMDPRQVAALQSRIIVGAACGKLHTVALTEEGRVYSWGCYGQGQLGVGEVPKEKYPYGFVPPLKINGIDRIRAVACGYFHTVMIDDKGDLLTCGTHEHFAHGHDSNWDIPAPKLMDALTDMDFRQISCGAAHTIALTSTGRLFVWGLNDFGQLGLGDTNDRRTPEELTALNGKTIRKIACGATHSVILSGRDVFTFGNGTNGALGHGNSKSQLLPKNVIKLTEECRLRDVAAGPQFSVALSDLGQLYFWGNMKSTAGRGAKHVYNMPRRFKGLEAIYAVACGEHEISSLVRIPIAPPLEHKFRAGIFMEDVDNGLLEGFIGRACSWGKAQNGKLGHGSGKNSNVDLKIPFAIYGRLYHYSVTKIACGAEHSVCITDDGKLFCWGSNKEGQLGMGDTTARTEPTPIEYCRDPDEIRLKRASNKIFRDVVVGKWHNVAITTKRKVYTWGKNKYGQLGLGHTNNQSLPNCILPLSDPFLPKNVRSIAAGKSHSAVVVEDGDIYTWGRGWDGQLGHDIITEIELEPRIVPKMQNRSSALVACGQAHTVALTQNGNLWVWGDNSAGQLGIGSLKSTSSPVSVTDLDEQEVILVACGDEHTVCVTLANEVYGFGNGVQDQLGLGTLGIFPRPQRIPGLTAVSRIRILTCGKDSTAVLGGDDQAYLLGQWDGSQDVAASNISRHVAIRKSTRGTVPDTIDVPLGIQVIKDIALGINHGMIIGLEEDRQHLIQQRLDLERAEILENQADGDLTGDGEAQLKEVKRRQIVPYVKQDHGGEPFPDELDDKELHFREEDFHTMQADDDASQSDKASDYGTNFSASEHDDAASVKSGLTAQTASSAQSADYREISAIEPKSSSRRGYLVAWGNNQYNQLGCTADVYTQLQKENEKSFKKPLAAPKNMVGCPPTLIMPELEVYSMPSITTVACGESHTLAVGQDGTLWTWGRNQYGQLGHGDCKTHKLPRRVEALEKKICIKAAAGGQHSLVLTEANKVYAFGSNVFGQLGLESRVKYSSAPDIVSRLRRSGVCHVTCGYSHSFALLKSEQLYAWGRNDCGQLGLGHYRSSPVPEHLTMFKKSQVQQISCGYDHNIAFVSEFAGPGVPPLEKVYTWGRGEEGQLGHDELYSRCVPKVVQTLLARGIRAVAAGGFSSAAIDEAKQLYTWGCSREGQLGHGDDIDIRAPSIMKKPYSDDEAKPDVRDTFRARTVFLGPNYMLSMGLDAEEEKKVEVLAKELPLKKFAWGCNSKGQLGMPFNNSKKRKTGANLKAPEEIPFLAKWNIKEIACGLEHVVAIVEISVSDKDSLMMDDKLEKEMKSSVKKLLQDLKLLQEGDLESKDDQDEEEEEGEKGKELTQKAEDVELLLAPERDDDDIGDNEDDEKKKIFFPRQIYDRVHPVRPLLYRLGLAEEDINKFDQENIIFEDFITMKESDLLEMGITSFGVRRRLLRVIQELQQAKQVPENEGEDFELRLPVYSDEAKKDSTLLNPEFGSHSADFLEEGGLIQEEEESESQMGEINQEGANLKVPDFEIFSPKQNGNVEPNGFESSESLKKGWPSWNFGMFGATPPD